MDLFPCRLLMKKLAIFSVLVYSLKYFFFIQTFFIDLLFHIYIFLYYSAAWENPFLFVGRYCSLDMLSQTHNNPYTASAFFRCRKKCLGLYHVFSSFFLPNFWHAAYLMIFQREAKGTCIFFRCRKKPMEPDHVPTFRYSVKWIFFQPV